MKENASGLRTEKPLLKELNLIRLNGTVCATETGCSLLLEVINALGLKTEKRLLKEECPRTAG